MAVAGRRQIDAGHLCKLRPEPLLEFDSVAVVARCEDGGARSEEIDGFAGYGVFYA